MNQNQILSPANVPKPAGPYSQGVKASCGTIIFVSGQVAEDENGKIVGPDDPEIQTRKIFENIGRVLEQGSAKLEDIVKLTILLTNRDFYQAVAKVRREIFEGVFPAATLGIVSGLAKPEWLVEIEAIAIL